MFKYKNLLLKLSGEALSNGKEDAYDYDFCGRVADELITLSDAGVKLGVVVGGGNFWRGRQGGGIERTVADSMGMLATIMNGLFLADLIKSKGHKAIVLSSVEVNKICAFYTKDAAEEYLNKGYIVIYAGGTGSPYFSTDTAAALRAAETGAEVLLLAKKVDGIYTSDPETDPTAVKYDEISYVDFIRHGLKAMDSTAVTMCMDNKIPVFCFLLEEGAVLKAAKGGNNGTWIK